MKKFEYRVFNLSELKEKKEKTKVIRPGRNIVQALNEYGQEGWEIKFKLTDSSFLLQREIISCPLSEDIKESVQLSI